MIYGMNIADRRRPGDLPNFTAALAADRLSGLAEKQYLGSRKSLGEVASSRVPV
jgi:hypothetical protein